MSSDRRTNGAILPSETMTKGNWWSVRSPSYALIILSIAYFFSALDRMILTLMIVPIQRDLGITDLEFGILIGPAFAIFYLLAGFPIGMIVDSKPRKLIVAAGLSLWSLATLMSGLASRFSHLLMARICVGVGESALNPASYSMLSDLYPKEKLGRAIAIFQSGSLLGTTLAFAAGGALVAAAEPSGALILPFFGEARVWQVIFIGIGVPGIILAFFTLVISEPARTSKKGSQSSMREFIAFLGKNKLLVSAVIGGVALVALVSYSWMAWLPALLIRERGISAGTAGLIMALASGLCGMAGYLIGGLGSDFLLRRGVSDAHMRVSFLGSLIAIPLAFLFFATDALPLSIGAACVLCCLMAMPVAPTIAALQLVTPPDMRGRISALYMICVTGIGAGIGPVLVPTITLILPEGNLRHSLQVTVVVGLLAAASLFHATRKPYGAILGK